MTGGGSGLLLVFLLADASRIAALASPRRPSSSYATTLSRSVALNPFVPPPAVSVWEPLLASSSRAAWSTFISSTSSAMVYTDESPQMQLRNNRQDMMMRASRDNRLRGFFSTSRPSMGNNRHSFTTRGRSRLEATSMGSADAGFLPPPGGFSDMTDQKLGGSAGGQASGKVGTGSGGKRKKKVLILMSDTGGGHRASAQALEAAFNELYPDQIECSTVDIWTDYAPWPYNQFVPAYQYMAKNPLYWKAFWEYGRFPPTKWGTEETSNMACHHRFRACIESQAPDLVVSVHPLCQDIPLRVLTTIGQGRRQIPFVTVVTDLGGAHPTWFHKEVDLCFVPSDPVRKLALKMGLKPDQIRQHGLPVRPGFWKPDTKGKTVWRKELGVKDARTALVVGGGDGIGNLVDITSAMATEMGKEDGDRQIVVVCGKNEKIKKQLLSKRWPANVNVVVKGFVNNMDQWMAASDCIVTKAGPGTIAEASIRGLPVMLFNFLPGQEEGNVPYVTENGFGDYSKDPKTIAKVVSGWLHSDEAVDKLSKAAKAAARPSSTVDIAGEIGALLFGDWQLPRLKDTEAKFQDLFKKLTQPLTL